MTHQPSSSATVDALAKTIWLAESASSPAQELPRRPTEAMLNAARDWSVKKYGVGIGNDAAIGCWQAMLEASAVTLASRPAQAVPDPLTRRERAEMIWAVLKSYMLDECSFDCAAVSPADEKNLINEIYNSIPAYSVPSAHGAPPEPANRFCKVEGCQWPNCVVGHFCLSQPGAK